MNMSRRWVFWGVTVLAGCGGDDLGPQESIAAVESAITNGNVESDNAPPLGQVETHYSGINRCNATLISNDLAVGARHCGPLNSDPISICYGTDCHIGTQIGYYSPGPDAIVYRVSPPFNFNGSQTDFHIPIRYATAASRVGQDITCYGRTTYNYDPVTQKCIVAPGPEHLRSGTLHVDHVDNMGSFDNLIVYRNALNQIVAEGDSGGGCFKQYENGTWYLVGVISGADVGPEPLKEPLCNLGVITDASGFIRWVQEEDGQWASRYINSNYKVLTGDFDGDMKTDVMYFPVGYPNGTFQSFWLQVGLSNGTNAFNFSSWAYWSTNANMKVLTGDFDGNGKTDIMKFDVDDSGAFFFDARQK